MSEKKLVVSVHDVTPKFGVELSEIVAELDRIGIEKRSLLVVPDWEGKNDLRRCDTFVAWLHELQGKKDEIVQHGCTHQSTKRQGHYKSLLEKFMGETFAQGMGEFQNLSYQEAIVRTAKGMEIFSDIELKNVKGFVAPAWLVNPDVERALKDVGFKYHIYTTFCNYAAKLSVIPIRNLETGETTRSREIAFDGSRKLIDYGTRGLAWLLTRNKKATTTRIAIHPQDIHNARPFDYALRLIEEAKEGRETCTYNQLLAP